MGKFTDEVRAIYKREVPANAYEWHARNMFVPVRCIDGRWALNVMRRKRGDGRWEYVRRRDRAEDPRDTAI